MKRLKNSLLAVVVGAVTLLSSAVAKAEMQPVQVKTADGVTIYLSYWAPKSKDQSGGTQETPVVVLLHGSGGSRLQWDKGTTLPKDLEDKGYAVISVDLRKHGESLIGGKKESAVPADYERMVLGDLVAVKQFIFDRHMAQELNMNKMVIVAADIMVPVAMQFAELDWRQAPYDDSALPAHRTPRGQDVKVIVGISPEPNAGTIRTAASLNFLKGPPARIAFLLIVGEGDAASKKEAETLNKVFVSGKANVERGTLTVIPQLKDHGMELVMKDTRRMSPHIVGFIEKQLATLGNPWQDRRSRLER